MKRLFSTMRVVLLLLTIALATLYINVQAAMQLSILARGTAGANTHLLMMEPRSVYSNELASSRPIYEGLRQLPSLVPEVTDVTMWSTRSISQIYLRGQALRDMHIRREQGVTRRHSTLPLLGKVSPQMKSTFGLSLKYGRFISDDDVRNGARVAVIGPEIHVRFGGGDVIGEGITLTLIQQPFPGTFENYIAHYTIVGVLGHRMPLLSAMFNSRRETVRLLLSRILHVPLDNPESIETAQAVQREQLIIANTVLNVSVLVPRACEAQEAVVSTPPLIYFTVDLPEDACGELVRDQVSHSYFPRGIAEVNDKIRAALLPSVGPDYKLLFLYQGTFADHLRVQARPVLWILGRIVAAGLFLVFLLTVGGLLLPIRSGRPRLWSVRALYKANSHALAMAISLGAVLGLALNVAVLGLDVSPPVVVSMAFLLLALAVARQWRKSKVANLNQ